MNPEWQFRIWHKSWGGTCDLDEPGFVEWLETLRTQKHAAR